MNDRIYMLPGGRAGVRNRRQWLRAAVWGAWLFGPMYLAVMAASRYGSRSLAQRAIRTWAEQTIRALRITLEIRGLERVDPAVSYVVMPLHESLVDGLVLQRLHLPMTWVVRDEFLHWRFVGPFLRTSGQVAVCPEEAAATYRALLRATKATVHRCESIVVFPQGAILGIEAAFQRGAFAASRAAGAHVLPVVITGTHRVWEHPYTPLVRFGQHVTVEILDPIAPEDLDGAGVDLEHRMKEAALAHERSSPRRYDPDRDGWWDGYRFDIDPGFSVIAAKVAAHRSEVRGEPPFQRSMRGSSRP